MTVKQWGIGRPDYYKPTAPARPSIITEEDTQIRWFKNKKYDISSMAYSSALFYTIPADYRLALGAVDVTADNSCINELRLLDSKLNLLGEIKFDMRGTFIFTDLAGQSLPSAETITVYIYNNNVIRDEFSVTMSGILERERE